jgi:hypothetical protein
LWITEREHDGGRLVIQGTIKKMGLASERPRDEAATDARVAGRQEFPIELLLVAVAQTYQAEAARFGDRSRQRSTGRPPHRRKQDGMADAELFRELSAEWHGLLPSILRGVPRMRDALTAISKTQGRGDATAVVGQESP